MKRLIDLEEGRQVSFLIDGVVSNFKKLCAPISSASTS